MRPPVVTARLVTRATLPLLCLLAVAPAAGAGPYEIPARWTEPAGSGAAGMDFRFTRIESHTDAGTVILGDSVVLWIRQGRPFVTLAWSEGGYVVKGAADRALAIVADRKAVFAGRRPSSSDPGSYENFLLERSGSEWREVAGPRDENGKWSIVELAARSDGTLFALLGGRAGASRLVMRAGDESWRSFDPPLARPDATIQDLCMDGEDGLWLAIASPGKNGAGRRGFLLGHVRGMWRTFVPPPPEGRPERWNMARLACSGGLASLWALGHRGDGGGSVLWQRSSDGWKMHESRDLETTSGKAACTELSSLATDGKGRAAVACHKGKARTDSVLMWEGNRWREQALPAVPAAAHYQVGDMAFGADGTLWAISGVSGGATTGRGRGLILGFEDGVWRERGFAWSRLRQRLLGLLGGLL